MDNTQPIVDMNGDTLTPRGDGTYTITNSDGTESIVDSDGNPV
jgi:hypothetical protein